MFSLGVKFKIRLKFHLLQKGSCNFFVFLPWSHVDLVSIIKLVLGPVLLCFLLVFLLDGVYLLRCKRATRSGSS